MTTNIIEQIFTDTFYTNAKTFKLNQTRELPIEIEIQNGICLGSESSNWGKSKKIRKINKLTGDYEDDVAEYRTKFDLYVSSNNIYYLHKLGESTLKSEDTFKSIITFSTPNELGKMLQDSSKKELRISKPIISLLRRVANSKYLTKKEQKKWESLLKSEV